MGDLLQSFALWWASLSWSDSAAILVSFVLGVLVCPRK